MREVTIARNYAETLLTLAQRAGNMRGWGEMLLGLAEAAERDRTLHAFLVSPRVGPDVKASLLGKAFQDTLPATFVRFLQALARHRRESLLPEIAREYMDLVDQAENRMHATVQVATEPDQALRESIAQQLSRAFGKTVVPHFTVNPEIMGGVVVRVGDTVLDGSVRRKLGILRNRMLAGRA